MSLDREIPTDSPDWLIGGGAMGAAIRSFDWSLSPLGSHVGWPPSLRVALGICLGSRFPMYIWWGAELINLYNDAYIPILGRRHADALSRSARDIWHDRWDIVGPRTQAVMLQGESTWSERQQHVLDRNGYPEEAYFTFSHLPLRDEAGRIVGLMCTVNEDTARITIKRERDRLANQRQLALDAAHMGWWHYDPDTKVATWDQRYAEIFGVVGSERPNEEILARLHPEDLPGVWARVEEALDPFNPRPYSAQYRIYRDDGSIRWVEAHGAASFEGDGVARKATSFVGTVADITDRKLAETQREQLLVSERAARSEAERASRMKDEFLATLSHELRTPLNAILGWAQILRHSSSNADDLQKGLTTIERNARAQTQIIEDLLDMSRIISGKIRLDVQRLDLAPVVLAALDTVKPAADAKGVRLQTVLDSVPSLVSGESGRLQQIFWNLLSNAVKFTPRGGRVQVVLERVNSHLEVAIIDTGEGIRPDFLPHVFDRFTQADGSTTRRHGGLGLGLAIVKQLIELHGGSVRAKSPGPGQGATFIVALPLVIDHADPPSDVERRHPRAGSTPMSIGELCVDIAGTKVLVVDDEPDARDLIRRILEDCKATVTVAGSVADAMAKIQAERPDVLVSDIGMPGEDGYVLMRRVRALAPTQGGMIPAVALTAYARSEDRMKAVLAGFQHHVAKPVEPAELITMISSLARGK